MCLPSQQDDDDDIDAALAAVLGEDAAKSIIQKTEEASKKKKKGGAATTAADPAPAQDAEPTSAPVVSAQASAEPEEAADGRDVDSQCLHLC